MYFPMFNETDKSRDMVTAFQGYNHNIQCSENEFFDMKNMTSKYYPALSPRDKRGICKNLTNPQGILDKEELMWIDGANLYKNGVQLTLATGVTISTEADMCPKTMAKMGAYVIIMPDRIWYNVDNNESGYMEKSFTNVSGTTTADVTVTLCDENGTAITWHDDTYYTTHDPAAGDYCVTTLNGKSVLKQWSESGSIWMTVNTNYIQIACTGIGVGFEKEDGVKITIDNSTAAWTEAGNIFVNEEDDGKLSVTTVITDRTDDCITIQGIISANKEFKQTTSNQLPISVERKTPDMAFITECNNRLWGCSKDGHELYCCKLGDVKNWNCFKGISTDSWAATIGSDGKFTGAITYLGYPIFFKEDSLIKIAVSSTGGHQTKETHCRGVQKGSERSLCIVNEVLFYKSTSSICAYDGSLPASISAKLGEVRYTDASAGTIDNRYFITMKDSEGVYHLFAYDTNRGMWHKEDNLNVLYFCKHGDELYFIDNKDHKLKSIGGTIPFDVTEKKIEDDFEWYVSSGDIGYSNPDNKYVSRINIRLTIDYGSRVDLYIQYDSSGTWEHMINMTGRGTRSFTVPVIPRRCDHFQYKISGKGNSKIYSIAKIIETGSDV